MDQNPTWFQKMLALDPLIVRGVILSFFGLLGAVGLSQTDGTAEAVLGFAMGLLALLGAIWGRPAVTPNAKVLAYQPRPIDAPQLVKAGEAAQAAGSETADQAAEVIKAA